MIETIKNIALLGLAGIVVFGGSFLIFTIFGDRRGGGGKK